MSRVFAVTLKRSITERGGDPRIDVVPGRYHAATHILIHPCIIATDAKYTPTLLINRPSIVCSFLDGILLHLAILDKQNKFREGVKLDRSFEFVYFIVEHKVGLLANCFF